jgi:hypothetical protein
MIFRQLFHADTGTYTYLLGCEGTREARCHFLWQ